MTHTTLSDLNQYFRIALYPGASGTVYFLNFLKSFAPELLKKIVGIGDGDASKNGLEIDGLEIFSLERLPSITADVILLNTILHAPEIRTQLEKVLPGVPVIDVNSIEDYLHSVSSYSKLAQENPCKLSDGDLEKELAELGEYYLSIPFGSKRFSNSSKAVFTYELLNFLDLPESLEGLDVFDIGASDGFYSFECEARGAKSVTAADGFAWSDEKVFNRFLRTRELLNSNIRYENKLVEDYEISEKPEFDIILALGLYYHLKDPALAFRKFHSLTRSKLVVSGRIVVAPFENPLSPGQEAPYLLYNNPACQKWMANKTGLLTMLSAVGFRETEVNFELITPGNPVGSIVVTAYK